MPFAKLGLSRPNNLLWRGPRGLLFFTLPPRVHEVAHSRLSLLFTELALPMGLRDNCLPFGRFMYRSCNDTGPMKEGESGILPNQAGILGEQFPTLVIECGSSEVLLTAV